jgi:hypothetical protein
MPNTPYPLSRDGQLAFDRARRIAEQYKQPSVDSLMLLHALLQLPNSRVQAALISLNVKVENLSARILATIKLEAQQSDENSEMKRVAPGLTSESESVLNASLTEMAQNGNTAIDDLTLLMGMLQSPESKAGQILSQYAVTTEQARERIKIIKEMPAPKNSISIMPKTLARGMRQGISPIFISLVLFTVAMACFLYLGVGNNPRAFLIAFVMGGWIVSVALHEFGHAITAFWGGDESVEHKGYLTLNPLKYSNPFLSIILPVLMLLMGGIGFPGGAVYINTQALKKPNYRSLVSAAGPLANLLCVILLALPFDNIPFSLFFWSAPDAFLNGFGILEPFLPRDLVGFSSFVRPFGFVILYLFVFVDSPISDVFWNTVWIFTDLFSPNLAYYANEGLRMFLNVR